MCLDQGCAILIGIELVIEMIIENSPIFRYRIDIESVFGISYYRYWYWNRNGGALYIDIDIDFEKEAFYISVLILVLNYAILEEIDKEQQNHD